MPDRHRSVSIIEREKATKKFRKPDKVAPFLEKDEKVETMIKKIEIVSEGYNFLEAKILLVLIFVISGLFLMRESMSLSSRITANKESLNSLMGQYKSLGGNLKDLEKYHIDISGATNIANNTSISKEMMDIKDNPHPPPPGRLLDELTKNLKITPSSQNLKKITNQFKKNIRFRRSSHHESSLLRDQQKKILKLSREIGKVFEMQLQGLKNSIKTTSNSGSELSQSLTKNKIIFLFLLVLFPVMLKITLSHLNQNLYIQMRNFLDIENQQLKREGINFKINYKLDQVTVCMEDSNNEIGENKSRNSRKGSKKSSWRNKNVSKGRQGGSNSENSGLNDEGNELLTLSRSNGISSKKGSGNRSGKAKSLAQNKVTRKFKDNYSQGANQKPHSTIQYSLKSSNWESMQDSSEEDEEENQHQKNMQEFITQGGVTELLEDSDDDFSDNEKSETVTATVQNTEDSLSQLLRSETVVDCEMPLPQITEEELPQFQDWNEMQRRQKMMVGNYQQNGFPKFPAPTNINENGMGNQQNYSVHESESSSNTHYKQSRKMTVSTMHSNNSTNKNHNNQQLNHHTQNLKFTKPVNTEPPGYYFPWNGQGPYPNMPHMQRLGPVIPHCDPSNSQTVPLNIQSQHTGGMHLPFNYKQPYPVMMNHNFQYFNPPQGYIPPQNQNQIQQIEQKEQKAPELQIEQCSEKELKEGEKMVLNQNKESNISLSDEDLDSSSFEDDDSFQWKSQL